MKKNDGNNKKKNGNVNEKLVHVGALWNRVAEDGKKYKGGLIDIGPLGKVPVALFHETEKKTDKHPDFVMFCEKSLIGAFWFRKKNGKKFLSGAILGVPVNIFRVTEKKSDKSADYVIVRFPESESENEDPIEESF